MVTRSLLLSPFRPGSAGQSLSFSQDETVGGGTALSRPDPRQRGASQAQRPSQPRDGTEMARRGREAAHSVLPPLARQTAAGRSLDPEPPEAASSLECDLGRPPALSPWWPVWLGGPAPPQGQRRASLPPSTCLLCCSRSRARISQGCTRGTGVREVAGTWRAGWGPVAGAHTCHV